MIDANDIPSSQLILYADDGYDSHVVRLLLEEKKLAYYLSRLHSERPEDLTELNPYHTLPVLQQREIALYEPTTVMVKNNDTGIKCPCRTCKLCTVLGIDRLTRFIEKVSLSRQLIFLSF